MPTVRVLAASVLAALTLAPAAHAAKSSDSIWINPAAGQATVKLSYGDSFTAGYSSKVSQPWGYAECKASSTSVLGASYTPGSVIWSEYLSLWPGGPSSGPFQLIDPIQQMWLGGGANCTLSLVKFTSGLTNRTVLATTSFIVG